MAKEAEQLVGLEDGDLVIGVRAVTRESLTNHTVLGAQVQLPSAAPVGPRRMLRRQEAMRAEFPSACAAEAALAAIEAEQGMVKGAPLPESASAFVQLPHDHAMQGSLASPLDAVTALRSGDVLAVQRSDNADGVRASLECVRCISSGSLRGPQEVSGVAVSSNGAGQSVTDLRGPCTVCGSEELVV
jgi:hypothetical protein